MLIYSSLLNILKYATISKHFWFHPNTNKEIKKEGCWHMELIHDFYLEFGISKEEIKKLHNPHWDDHFYKLAWNNGWLRIAITKNNNRNELSICGTNLTKSTINNTINKYGTYFNSDFDIYIENGITYSNISSTFKYSDFLKNPNNIEQKNPSLTRDFR